MAIPSPVRAVGALSLVGVGSRLDRRWGDPLLVVAVTLALPTLPTLGFTGLSLLVAVVPMIVAGRRTRSA